MKKFLALFCAFLVAAPDMALATTLYASASGSGTTCSTGSPCSVNQLVAGTSGNTLGPDDIGILANGTYTGVNGMIVPASGRAGSSGHPITLQAETDGGVLIDGQTLRIPIRLATGNSWWVITGINAAHADAGSNVVDLDVGATHNIVRRTIGWDAGDRHAVFNSSDANNLFEDVAGFGQGRKTFGNSQGSDGVIYRRAFGIWNKSTGDVGPSETFSNTYNSHNGLYENVIGTIDPDPGVSVANGMYGVFIFERMNDLYDGTYASVCAGSAKYLGSIAYVTAAETPIITTDPMNVNNSLGLLQGGLALTCIHYKDVVAYADQAVMTASNATLSGIYSGPAMSGDHTFDKVTEIRTAGTRRLVDTDWQVTNSEQIASVAAADNIWNGTGGTGARVCYQYVDGTLTTTPLWPWPMNQRIIDAMTTASRTPIDVTATMESIFGTIPPDCIGASPDGSIVRIVMSIARRRH
jgi:hypothetical protein